MVYIYVNGWMILLWGYINFLGGGCRILSVVVVIGGELCSELGGIIW